MSVQLTDVQKTIVKNILEQKIPGIPYKIFGSRAKGTARQYSDLDLILITTAPLALVKLAELEECFAESDLPFKVDLIDWQRITPEFQERIQSEWVEL